MKTKILILLFALVASWSLQAKTYTVDNLPNVQKQDSTQLLVNPDGIISQATAQRVNDILRSIRSRTSMEAVAVVVDNISPDDIEEFSTQFFNKWGIGKKDNNNGLLILVAKDMGAVRIQPGYGAEGVLPDAVCSRIIRNDMIPYFKEGDFDTGLLKAVERIQAIVTDPEAAKELMSDEADSADVDMADAFQYYIYAGVFVAVVLLMWYFVTIIAINDKKKNLTDMEKYERLRKCDITFLLCTVFFIGIPILAYLLLRWSMHSIRNHPRNCPNCNAKMQKLDEQTDNQYLTPAQDLEEKINSVDYDVWLCPTCGATEINSFRNHSSTFKECPNCHTFALQQYQDVVIKQPTTSSQGYGERYYRCLNCNHRKVEKYTIPKNESGAIAAGAIASGILSGGGGSRGGFGGGGFGGGMTGGGGATGRW